MQYANKLFIRKPKEDQNEVTDRMWDSVCSNDKKSVYGYIVSCGADVNFVRGQECSTSPEKLISSQESSLDRSSSFLIGDAASALDSASTTVEEDQNAEECVESCCSLVHVACQTADIGMVELLLQYGANINAPDSRGQTPLHHCILGGKSVFAKLLISRYVPLYHVQVVSLCYL